MNTWTLAFGIINVFVLISVFIFSRIGAISWELVLTKKHNDELENFMVVLALFFAASYGGVMAYSLGDLQLSTNNLHLIGTIVFFLFMNIVILLSSAILMTYLVSSFRSTSRTMTGIFLLINSSLFIYEVLAFDKTYYNEIKEVKCIELDSNCTKGIVEDETNKSREIFMKDVNKTLKFTEFDKNQTVRNTINESDDSNKKSKLISEKDINTSRKN